MQWGMEHMYVLYVDVMLLFVDDFNLFLDVYHVRGCLHKSLSDFLYNANLNERGSFKLTNASRNHKRQLLIKISVSFVCSQL